jgi:hypothetical protein
MKNYGLQDLPPQKPSAPSAEAAEAVPSIDQAIALFESARLDPERLGYLRGKFDTAMAVVRERPAQRYGIQVGADATEEEGEELKEKIEKAFPGVEVTRIELAGYGRPGRTRRGARPRSGPRAG